MAGLKESTLYVGRAAGADVVGDAILGTGRLFVKALAAAQLSSGPLCQAKIASKELLLLPDSAQFDIELRVQCLVLLVYLVVRRDEVEVGVDADEVSGFN